MNEITKSDYIQTELKKFNLTDSLIAEMNQRYSTLQISGIEDKEGYALVKAARLDVKAKRVEVEKKRKELTADALKFQRAINSEAARITGLLEPIEERLHEMEKEIDGEKERIRIEKERLEQEKFAQRVKSLLEVGFEFDGVQYKANYEYSGSNHTSDNIVNIAVLPLEIKNYSEEDFGELYAHCYLYHEEKQKYLAEEKRKQEELQAKIEADRKAETERLEQLRKEQLAKEAEERRIENERLEKIRLQQEEENKRLEFERKKQAEAEARIKAEQEAERKRLEIIAKQQAEKEAALKAEADRIQNEKFQKENKSLDLPEKTEVPVQNPIATHKIEIGGHFKYTANISALTQQEAEIIAFKMLDSFENIEFDHDFVRFI